jgi:hypothetical protein
MKLRMHTLSVQTLVVLFALSAALTAQHTIESDPELVLRADAQRRAEWASTWLHSEDPRQVAWGAWVARRDHQTALIPLLIEKVEEYQPVEEFLPDTVERNRHDALLVVLDALIGLGAALPVKETRKLYPEFAAQSLILLLRSGDNAQSALLDIFQSAKANWDWLAAGNVLVKKRPPGFAYVLLSRITQHITVSVVDRGVGGGGASGGSECGFSLRGPKPGWPGVGLYSLTQFPERMPGLSTTFLVDGDTTVYYWRVEPGNYDNPPDLPGSCDDGNRDGYRAQYVNKLTGFSDIRLNAYPHETIFWQGDADYKQQLLAVLEKQRASFHHIVMSLQQSGRVLTASEGATLKPRLEIMILDQRADRSVPLPVLSEHDVPAPITTFSKPLY